MSGEISLSIIIPCYNSGGTLKNTINSLETELSDNFSYEILIINDGSTDNTSEIVKNIMTKNNRIKFFTKRNGGVSSARNLGIEKAIGEYIWFFDADDLIFKGSIAKLKEIIEKHKPDLLCFSSVTVDNTNHLNIEHYNNCGKFKITFDDQYYKFLNLNHCHSFVWQHFIKRSIINQTNIRYDEQLWIGEDSYFNISLAKENPFINFIITDLRVVKYIVYSSSATNTSNFQKNLRSLNSYLYLYNKIIELEEKNISFLHKTIANQKNNIINKIITRYLSCKTSYNSTRNYKLKINQILNSNKDLKKTAIISFFFKIQFSPLLIMLCQFMYRNAFLRIIKPRLGRN